ncbi:MAG: sialidase family protein, partial [Clostridia bacterium]
MLGQICMDIAPQPDNRRNSEGALITCRDESILFVYSRFQGDGMQAADLAAMRSRDDGRTFSASRVIVTHTQDQAENIMSVSLLRMQDGQIGLFYLVRHTLHCMRMFLRRSADEGETWSEKTLCTPEEGYFVVNNDRVVRLRDGTLLIPAAIHRKGYAQTPGDAGFFDMRSDAVFFRSRDDGKTWQKSANKCTMPYTAHCQSGLQEPGVIELASGVLWGWARTDLGRQYEMFSMDGGETWTCAQPSRFTSPNS